VRGVPIDVFGVNPKTLGRIFSALFVGIALVGWAPTATAAPRSTDAPPVVEMGNGILSITRVAKNGFHRDVEALKTQAVADATDYCAVRGKQLRVVSLTSEKPWITLGYCKATVVFKALDAGDPELAGEPAPVAGSGRPAYVAASQPPPPVVARGKPMTTSELYAALTQLDDLRKKNILSEEEFQTEKQKLLKHTQ
jgi:hypothetical protein